MSKSVTLKLRRHRDSASSPPTLKAPPEMAPPARTSAVRAFGRRRRRLGLAEAEEQGPLVEALVGLLALGHAVVGAVAAENTACHQQIAVASRVKLGGARRPCRGNLDCRLAFQPCDRKV